MQKLQRSWVRSQHPSAQWNLRGGRRSSAEYCTNKKKKKKSPQKIKIKELARPSGLSQNQEISRGSWFLTEPDLLVSKPNDFRQGTKKFTQQETITERKKFHSRLK
jgi:hypothetical protein